MISQARIDSYISISIVAFSVVWLTKSLLFWNENPAQTIDKPVPSIPTCFQYTDSFNVPNEDWTIRNGLAKINDGALIFPSGQMGDYVELKKNLSYRNGFRLSIDFFPFELEGTNSRWFVWKSDNKNEISILHCMNPDQMRVLCFINGQTVTDSKEIDLGKAFETNNPIRLMIEVGDRQLIVGINGRRAYKFSDTRINKLPHVGHFSILGGPSCRYDNMLYESW
jgi:hypothetical protein